MNPLIFTLILLPLYVQSTNGNACQRLPPGLDRLVRGIDMTVIDLIPTTMTIANGFHHPVIDFTCNTNRKWTNPSDPSITYDIPDQVDSINGLPGGIVDFRTNLYKSHEDVKKSMSANLGISLLSGFFSLSGSYAHSQESILNNMNMLTESSAYVSAYEIELKPYFKQKIAADAQEFIDKLLPATYQQNPDKYQEFLSTFGSHFFSAGYFGGYLTTKIEITQSLSDKMNDNQIKAEAEASFLGIVKVHGGYTGQTSHVSEEFKQSSHIHEAYYGGNANLLSSGAEGYSQWWNTVARNPWLFGGRIQPITDLLPDGPKKVALSQAMLIRQDLAYVDELIRSIDYVSKLVLTNKTIATSYRNQLIGLKGQPIPNHSAVMSLGTTVNTFALTERNKSKTECTGYNNLTHQPMNCVTVRNSNPSSSYFESYSNKTIVDLDPKIINML